MYLLDTNICIDFLRGRLPYGYRLLRESDPRLYKIPAVVEAELHLGVAKSRLPRENKRLVEEFLLPFETIPFSSECSHTYARIRAYLEERGTPIEPNDLFIAATALAHEAVLVTNNWREFKKVPGLEVESWGEIDLES